MGDGMKQVLDLSITDMLISLSLVLAALVVSLRHGLALERTILWGVLRTVV